MQPDKIESDGDPQDNFVEARDPTELAMCFILAAAYLGLAKYCWHPLQDANFKLFLNVEGFFITIAVLSMLVGMRPYMSPSSLQLSGRGIKYKGPYWPKRKTVNWDQVFKLYLSPEIIIVLFKNKPESKRIWPMVIMAIYLSDRDQIVRAFVKYAPLKPIIMTSPTLFSRIVFGLCFLIVVLWILEMMMP
jgi:hypothetical protein